MAIQIISRNQVSHGNEAICAKHIKMPRIGNKGTKGVLKGRGVSGLVRRSTITLPQTITNASNVPIDTSSPNNPIGNKPATTAANAPVIMVVT